MEGPSEASPRGLTAGAVRIWILCGLGATVWAWSGLTFLAHNTFNDADSSFFVYGGWWLNQGGELYEGFFDMKPPAIFWQNAVLLQLFGWDFMPWAWAHGVAVALVLVGFIAAVRHLWAPRVLAVGTLLMVYAFFQNKVLDFGNRTEFGVALAEWMVLVCFLFSERRPKLMLLAGFFSAVAFLFKPVGLASLLATLAWGAFFFSDASIRHRMIFMLGGFGITLLIAFAWVSPVALFDAALRIPAGFTLAAPSLSEAIWGTWMRLGPIWGLMWPWLLWPLAWRWGDRRRLVWMTLFLGATFCGVVAQRHGRPHYDHTLMIPLVFGSMEILRVCTRSSVQRTLVFAMLLLSTLATGRYFILQQINRAQSWPQRAEALHQPMAEAVELCRQNLEAGGGFLYWGFGYVPYLMLDRAAPTAASPAFLEFGDGALPLFEQEFSALLEGGAVKVILENPSSFPLGLDIDAPQLASAPGVQNTLKDYQAWKEANFQRVHGQPGELSVWVKR